MKVFETCHDSVVNQPIIIFYILKEAGIASRLDLVNQYPVHTWTRSFDV